MNRAVGILLDVRFGMLLDYQKHDSDVDASVKAADQRITQINSELSTQKIIQKHCDSYRLSRIVDVFSDTRLSIRFWIFSELGILVMPKS